MPTDICETILQRISADFDGECHLTDIEARDAADTIESLRAEVSRLSAELEGARKETIEEMGSCHDVWAGELTQQLSFIQAGTEFYRQIHLEREHHRTSAAAIRQKGERGC